jgi:hypothetical protein
MRLQLAGVIEKKKLFFRGEKHEQQFKETGFKCNLIKIDCRSFKKI